MPFPAAAFAPIRWLVVVVALTAFALTAGASVEALGANHSIQARTYEVPKIPTEVVSPRDYRRRRNSTKSFLTIETIVFLLSYVVLISGFYLLGGEHEAKDRMGGKIGSIEATRSAVCGSADERPSRRVANHCR